MTKILLIDDDPDVRSLMSITLKNEGYQVATAGCREDALASLEQDLPSLIILDVLLSGTDGRDLCRELKAADKTKDIPIIMFSGHPGAALQFESYGADDFVAKPINAESLLQKLTQQINLLK